MKGRILRIAVLFAAAVIAAAVLFTVNRNKAVNEDVQAENILALNEIEQLYKAGDSAAAEKKVTELEDKLRNTSPKTANNAEAVVFAGISIGFMGVLLLYVYFSILRPFDKLKHFADEIAKGNFSIPLDYERSNYFGSFTWAFDSMRREITKARTCEREAIENNKTVIATLSHDIKTPIASIRAYAEGLEANLDSTPEKRAKYLSVLMRKCDEVSALTNDLFLHSLADLDKLKMSSEEIELSGFIREAVEEISGEKGDVRFRDSGREIYINGDRNRLMQLCENLINNARKYAGTNIEITLSEKDGYAAVAFRDHGGGIPDEDMPFITDKFYRGHNCGSEQGSGLGLYIVSYICGQLGGELSLRNHPEGGLDAETRFPIRKTYQS
ncbi:Signal transduction histidine kinase [Ruminococcaceae bacterium FB2012]|nr:Signal transduction histidine kinase [Ruminococcaceae bacterium FB2012]